jgi:hypothetical protein
MSVRVCLIVLCVLVASAGADQAPPRSMRDALAADAKGRPVYLAATPNGVVAAAADGAWSKTLLAKPVDSAAWDPRQDLLWLLREHRLEVLDLREEAPSPVPILANVPDNYAPQFAVQGVSSAGTYNGYSFFYTILIWQSSGEAKLELGQGLWSDLDMDQLPEKQKELGRVKIVGAKWLKAQRARAPHAVPSPTKPARLPDVVLPKGMGKCEVQDICGHAESFGATGLVLVVAKHECGDACHTGCVLYDPAKKLFASPDNPGVWAPTMAVESGSCADYQFSGDHYLSNDIYYHRGSLVCTLKACTTLESTAIGWLDGSM